MVQSSMLRASSPSALGIGATSFFREGGDEAEKDIAESPTACRNAQNRNSEFQNFRISEKCRFKVQSSKFKVQWLKVQWLKVQWLKKSFLIPH